jgi:hypothetical protein
LPGILTNRILSAAYSNVKKRNVVRAIKRANVAKNALKPKLFLSQSLISQPDHYPI